MGFFKFLKKGKREEGRDLDAAMSWEDIPPAPKPFEMKPEAAPDQFRMPDMPDISKIEMGGEDVEIPAVPDTGDIEKTISPLKITPDKSRDERFFEDIPFPGMGKKDFGAPDMPPAMRTEAVPKASRAFEEPVEEPRPIEAPKVPAAVVEPPKLPEPKRVAAPPKEEHVSEFKYIKERANVDFSQPLFLNLEQCETIAGSANDMRRELADYEESYLKLCDSFTVSDKQFQKWRLALEDTLKKLFEIDKGLFKAG